MQILGPVVERDPAISSANWLDASYNRWSVWHVRELVPTHRIRTGTPGALPRRPDPPDLRAVPVVRVDGSGGTVGEVLDDTYTDAFAVLHGEELVDEGYAPAGGPDQPHVVMSVSKSMIACVVAALADRGMVDLEQPVESYVWELSDTGYAGATVRDVLDMRSGVRFVEDYLDPESDVRQMDRWVDAGGEGLYPFLVTLGADRPHNGSFLYRSSETDVLGWVCERVAGRRMADLLSELLWVPLGAECDAEIICDSHGTPIHNGGVAATARDLLRFGQMLLAGGVAADGTTVVPPSWLRQAWAVDADIRQAFLESPSEVSFPGGWYRNQLWFRPGEYGDVLLCLGIHGQLVHVNRRTGTVCVKLSSWPVAQVPAFLQDTLRACDAIGGALVHRESTGDTHRLPGVVAGLDRHGSGSRRHGGVL